MQSDVIASRYAKALSSIEDEDIEKLEEEILFVADIFQKEKVIFDFFISPMVSSQNKKQIIQKYFKNKISMTLLNTLFLLIDKRRETEFINIQKKIILLNDRRLGRVRVNLILAREFSQILMDEVKKNLILFIKKNAQNFGIFEIPSEFSVLFNVQIDENIFGGLKIQIRDHYLDFSISRYLEDWKKNVLSYKLSASRYWSDV